MSLIIYNLILIFLFFLFLPFFIIKRFFSSSLIRKEWLQRFGCIESFQRNNKFIWIHCSSVGELNLSREFIKKLKNSLSGYKLVLSLMTPTGYSLAQRLNLPVEKIFYIPLDFWLFVRRALKRIYPEMLILVETEIWPNLISWAKRLGVKIVIVNGRISNKSFKFYKIFGFLFRNVFEKIDLFLMREKTDLERAIKLGASRDKVFYTGNMKFDFVLQNSLPVVTKRDFGFSEKDKIFVAGSIREGEEDLIIEAYSELRKKFSELKLIIAPRHLNRVNVIKKLLENRNMSSEDYFIIDTFGVLTNAYSIGDVIFVGGSLFPYGGQNIIEPASFGKPVVFGPYIENFREPAEILKKYGGGIQVRNVKELIERADAILSDCEFSKKLGQNARNAVLSMSGATDRNIEFLKTIL
ncbi:MAG: 3-deoxy-D-manno-octulosonic acid transferase [Endomicrobiia bacterium]